MSEAFGFELPEASRELTAAEYVNLVNRIRGNFLSYVSFLDSALTTIISNVFLRDMDDFALWSDTVFHDDRVATFGAKIFWIGKIMKNHAGFRGIGEPDRRRIQRTLDGIRVIRNDFAHSFAYNKSVDPRQARDRTITLHDFEGGIATKKEFGMQEIMDIINDPWLPGRLTEMRRLAWEIRGGGPR